MHSTGSMTRKFGPSRNASTGQTSTQSVYLQRMQASVTTKVMSQGLPVPLKKYCECILTPEPDRKQYTACIFEGHHASRRIHRLQLAGADVLRRSPAAARHHR